MNLRYFMVGATPREAQLALSYLVWPKEAPDPRLVDEWVRRHWAGFGTQDAAASRPQHWNPAPPGNSVTP
jgi:hypothetical protein